VHIIMIKSLIAYATQFVTTADSFSSPRKFLGRKRFDFAFLLQDDDDANSGIHFVATGGSYKRSNSQLRGRPISSHSSNDHHHHLNNQSVASSLNRVGSVTSILKNLFKRTGGTSAQSAGDGECRFISSQK